MKKTTIILATILSSFSYGQTESNCSYRVNEVDEFTGSSKLITTTSLYVEHTDSTLLKYYKNKKHSYFELQTYCGKINDLRALYMSIRIDSKDAYKYFGSISTGAKCIFKFEDGETLTINFPKYETGDMNYNGGYTTYSPYLVITDEDYETLRTKKVDKLRIYWSKGYEDYTVDFPEVLINQFNCIK
jgi:hypothetical protein